MAACHMVKGEMFNLCLLQSDYDFEDQITWDVIPISCVTRWGGREGAAHSPGIATCCRDPGAWDSSCYLALFFSLRRGTKAGPTICEQSLFVKCNIRPPIVPNSNIEW